MGCLLMNHIEIHVRRKINSKDVYPYTHNEDKRTWGWLEWMLNFSVHDWYVKKTYKKRRSKIPDFPPFGAPKMRKNEGQKRS